MEIRINGVNVFNPLEGKLDDIIECFVEFYGEKHREKITNNIKNAEYFFLPRNSFEPLSQEIEEYFAMEISNTYNDFYQKISPNERKMSQGLFDPVINIQRLQNLKNSINEVCVEKTKSGLFMAEMELNRVLQYLGVLKTAEDFAREHVEEKNISITPRRFKDIIDEFRCEWKSGKELEEYFSDVKNRQQLYEFIEMCEEKFSQLGYDKIIEKLRQEQENAMSQAKEIDEKIQLAIDKGKKRLENFCLEKINQCEQTANMSDWDKYKLVEKYERLLRTNLRTPQRFLGSLKNDFIALFNKLGFDLGDNLDDYFANPTIRQNMINDEIQVEYRNLQKENQKDLESSHEILNNCLDIIKKKELIHGEVYLMKAIAAYMKDGCSAAAFVTAGISKRGVESFLVCQSAQGINFNGTSSRDLELVHELGHIATTSSFVENGATTWKVGFDFIENLEEELLSEKTSSAREYGDKKYEALNEVINDYFTEDIYKSIREKNIVLNLGKQEQIGNGVYTYGFNLIGGFIENHNEEIKDALMSENLMAFAEVIGKENYDLLADACSKYLTEASNVDKLSTFIRQVNAVCDEQRISFYDAALYPQEWEERLLPYVDCFKKVAQVERNIQLAKTKNTEIDKTKDAEITL